MGYELIVPEPPEEWAFVYDGSKFLVAGTYEHNGETYEVKSYYIGNEGPVDYVPLTVDSSPSTPTSNDTYLLKSDQYIGNLTFVPDEPTGLQKLTICDSSYNPLTLLRIGLGYRFVPAWYQASSDLVLPNENVVLIPEGITYQSYEPSITETISVVAAVPTLNGLVDKPGVITYELIGDQIVTNIEFPKFPPHTTIHTSRTEIPLVGKYTVGGTKPSFVILDVSGHRLVYSGEGGDTILYKWSASGQIIDSTTIIYVLPTKRLYVTAEKRYEPLSGEVLRTSENLELFGGEYQAEGAWGMGSFVTDEYEKIVTVISGREVTINVRWTTDTEVPDDFERLGDTETYMKTLGTVTLRLNVERFPGTRWLSDAVSTDSILTSLSAEEFAGFAQDPPNSMTYTEGGRVSLNEGVQSATLTVGSRTLTLKSARETFTYKYGLNADAMVVRGVGKAEKWGPYSYTVNSGSGGVTTLTQYVDSDNVVTIPSTSRRPGPSVYSYMPDESTIVSGNTVVKVVDDMNFTVVGQSADWGPIFHV